MDTLDGKPVVENEPVVATAMKLRCPECFKLYSVNPLEIRESCPQFDCVACDTRFWVSYPECLEAADGVIGFPMEWLKADAAEQHHPLDSTILEDLPAPVELNEKPFQCPKCSEPYAARQNECFKCGVIFSKILDSTTTSTGVSDDVKELWEEVVSHYEDESLHQKFIQACWQEGALDYAMDKYQSILLACADDEVAQASKEQIVSMSEAQLEASLPSVHKERSLIQIFRKIRISAVLIFMCGILIAAGYFIPGFRNLMGLGVSVLFFVLALRYYFRVR